MSKSPAQYTCVKCRKRGGGWLSDLTPLARKRKAFYHIGAGEYLCRDCHYKMNPRGQANLPAVLAGLVLAVALMLAVGWVEDHAAAGARLLARVSTAVANLIESP